MSKLLFDESPLVVQPTLAKAIGLHEAIILQQINYWINLPAGGKVINGEKWIFNSLSDWQKQFPFLSESTIYRTLDNLEWANLIKTGNFNRRQGDKTKWYTIVQSTIDFLSFLIDYEKELEIMEQVVPTGNTSFQDGTPSRQDGTTLPETTPETTPDKDQISVVVLPELTTEEIWDSIPSAKNSQITDNGLIPILPEEKYLFDALNTERKARNYVPFVRFKTTKQREKFRGCVLVFNGSTNTQIDEIIANGKTDIEGVVNALDWRRRNNVPPPEDVQLQAVKPVVDMSKVIIR